jgi:cephalosporin hydroxylase
MKLLSKAIYKARVRVEKLTSLIGFSNAQDTVCNFHKKFYDEADLGGTWNNSTFLGVPIKKNPMDLMVFQEIMYDVKPDLIIETGTAFGGTTLYLATLCDALGVGEIVSIDVTKQGEPPSHPRITYILDSSLSDNVHAYLKSRTLSGKKVLVILDSDHEKGHVLKELELYKDYVTQGSYMIVEDTNINGHPVYPESGDGPMEALEVFLSTNNSFKSDKSREKYLLTFNPKGYLKRVA